MVQPPLSAGLLERNKGIDSIIEATSTPFFINIQPFLSPRFECFHWEQWSQNTNKLLKMRGSCYNHPKMMKFHTNLLVKIKTLQLISLSQLLTNNGVYEISFATVRSIVSVYNNLLMLIHCRLCKKTLAGSIPRVHSEFSQKWVLAPDKKKGFKNEKGVFLAGVNSNLIRKGGYHTKKLMNISSRTLCLKGNFEAKNIYGICIWMAYTCFKQIRYFPATLPDMWERTITIGSAGKTFSVTGWKTGWAYGPANLMVGPQVVHQHSVYTCTTPVQEAVARGFEIEIERLGTPECYFNSLPAELDVKRKMIAKMLSDAGIYPIIPEGGYFIMADVRDISKKIDVGGDPKERKDFRFVKWLSRNKKLQGIPPSAFYEDNKHIGENYIRFCFIKEDENLEKAASILIQLKKDIEEGKL
ncbi:unnamed protein product, partial [Meganyctiphanes norvegica]